MPELPEVEVLCRHLAPRLERRRIRDVQVLFPRLIAPRSVRSFRTRLQGATFMTLERRGKYICFGLRRRRATFTLIGHLGMTGRMYLLHRGAATPPQTAIQFDLGDELFTFEDPRQFGRMTFDGSALDRLGPEPLEPTFTAAKLANCLGESGQAIKPRLMNQAVLAGLGNIYASEILFEAGIHPRRPTRSLSSVQSQRLHRALRTVLRHAVRCGSKMPLDFGGRDRTNHLFYFGTTAVAKEQYGERLQVYDREHLPCPQCRGPIRRLQQAGRSTFFCPNCQR